jgi:hypothetical protein
MPEDSLDIKCTGDFAVKKNRKKTSSTFQGRVDPHGPPKLSKVTIGNKKAQDQTDSDAVSALVHWCTGALILSHKWEHLPAPTG